MAALFKKRLCHRLFPVNFAKLLGTHILQNTSGRLLLNIEELSCHLWIIQKAILVSNDKEKQKQNDKVLLPLLVRNVKADQILFTCKDASVSKVLTLKFWAMFSNTIRVLQLARSLLLGFGLCFRILSLPLWIPNIFLWFNVIIKIFVLKDSTYRWSFVEFSHLYCLK